MMRDQARLRVNSRGGVLFELLLAIAVFAGAAAFALASVKSVFAALDRSRRDQTLIDVARSSMAQLEAGIISLTDLRESGESTAITDGMSVNQQLNARGDGTSRVDVQVNTSRTEFTDLSLVEITVSELSAPGSGIGSDDALWFTLRQLMPLRGEGAE